MKGSALYYINWQGKNIRQNILFPAFPHNFIDNSANRSDFPQKMWVSNPKNDSRDSTLYLGGLR